MVEVVTQQCEFHVVQQDNSIFTKALCVQACQVNSSPHTLPVHDHSYEFISHHFWF